MDDFSRLSASERKPFFEAAATGSGLPLGIVEKDFWVCWTLKRLFGLPSIGEHLIFKGGTTLSKVYGVIERFSEDINISINRTLFGFSDVKDPEVAKSAKKQQQLIEDLSAACQKFVQTDLVKTLHSAMSHTLGTKAGWKLRVDEDDPDRQTLLFEYSAVERQGSGYVRPSVKIEMGARSDHWPAEIRNVRSYLGEQVAAALKEPDTAVKVLDVVRTFWEKATILHMYAHWPEAKTVTLRQSRHYYDLFRLIRSKHKTAALAKVELLKRVADHKRIYFRAAWAKYDEAAPGTLKLMPPAHVEAAMKKDYEQMKEMLFGETPTWDEIMSSINKFEAEVNARKRD